jgi:hypothetical protein
MTQLSQVRPVDLFGNTIVKVGSLQFEFSADQIDQAHELSRRKDAGIIDKELTNLLGQLYWKPQIAQFHLKKCREAMTLLRAGSAEKWQEIVQYIECEVAPGLDTLRKYCHRPKVVDHAKAIIVLFIVKYKP